MLKEIYEQNTLMVQNIGIKNQIVHRVRVLDLKQYWIVYDPLPDVDITFIGIDRTKRKILSRYTRLSENIKKS
jgi:hypothetical protein